MFSRSSSRISSPRPDAAESRIRFALVDPVTELEARQYTVGFSNSFLIRGVIRALSAEGFISDALNTPK